MNYPFKYIAVAAMAALSSAVLLSACEPTDYPTPTPATGPSTNQARFLFVNASPGAPALNFLIENTQVGQSRAFGEATGYLPAQVGPVQLRARAATGQIGGVLGNADIVFRAGATNQTNFSAVAGTNYTVFVTDTLNRPRPTATTATNLGGPQFLVVTDNLAAPTTGNAHVRFFHLAPDAPAVSVRFRTATNPSVATLLNRAYRVVSSGTGATAVNFANFTPLAAGTYTVDVFAGATVPSTGTPVLTVPNVVLENGKIYTIYARGLLRNRTLGAGIVQHN